MGTSLTDFRPKDRPTEKQHAFVREYLSNGRKAGLAYAVVYGQNFDGKTVTQAYARQGDKYLKNPKVRKLLAEAEAKVHAVTVKVMDRYAITQERVLEELARLAFSNQTDLVTWDKKNGITVKDSTELTEDEKAAIVEVNERENKDGTKKVSVKLADKQAALQTLAKHLGLLTEKHEHKHLSVNFVIEK